MEFAPLFPCNLHVHVTCFIITDLPLIHKQPHFVNSTHKELKEIFLSTLLTRKLASVSKCDYIHRNILGKFEYKNHDCLYHEKTLANINSDNSFRKLRASEVVQPLSFCQYPYYQTIHTNYSSKDHLEYTSQSALPMFEERERKSSTDFVFTTRN